MCVRSASVYNLSSILAEQYQKNRICNVSLVSLHLLLLLLSYFVPVHLAVTTGTLLPDSSVKRRLGSIAFQSKNSPLQPGQGANFVNNRHVAII